MAKKYKYQSKRKASENKDPRRWIWFSIGGSILVALGLVSAIWYDSATQPEYNPDVVFQTSDGRNHVQPGSQIEYSNYPPSSGDHYGSSLAWGVYDQPVDEGFWLHSMEHGGIVMLYNCEDDCTDLKTEMEDFYDSAPSNRCFEKRLIVMPYDRGMETPITILAWQHRLDLEEFDRRQIVDFYRIYEEMGPEALPCGVNGDVRM